MLTLIRQSNLRLGLRTFMSAIRLFSTTRSSRPSFWSVVTRNLRLGPPPGESTTWNASRSRTCAYRIGANAYAGEADSSTREFSRLLNALCWFCSLKVGLKVEVGRRRDVR